METNLEIFARLETEATEDAKRCAAETNKPYTECWGSATEGDYNVQYSVGRVHFYYKGVRVARKNLARLPANA